MSLVYPARILHKSSDSSHEQLVPSSLLYQEELLRVAKLCLDCVLRQEKLFEIEADAILFVLRNLGLITLLKVIKKKPKISMSMGFLNELGESKNSFSIELSNEIKAVVICETITTPPSYGKKYQQLSFEKALPIRILKTKSQFRVVVLVCLISQL